MIWRSVWQTFGRTDRAHAYSLILSMLWHQDGLVPQMALAGPKIAAAQWRSKISEWQGRVGTCLQQLNVAAEIPKWRGRVGTRVALEYRNTRATSEPRSYTRNNRGATASAVTGTTKP